MCELDKGGVAYLADLVELGQQAVPGLSGGKILIARWHAMLKQCGAREVHQR